VTLAGYAVASALFGVACNVAAPLGVWWAWLLTALAALPPLLTGAALCLFQPADAPPGAYVSPLMPLAPLLAVLVNGLLLASLQPLTWLRFLVWTAIGLLIYGLYGFRHSRAAEEAAAEDYEPLREEGGPDGGEKLQQPDEETRLS
uniref:AA_permease_C domain-containing protein n=1 Tax=Macrostomum lignano TaxID=282301 RepID=A0A1I8GKK8_9PLAT